MNLKRRLEGLEAKANADPGPEHYVYDPDEAQGRVAFGSYMRMLWPFPASFWAF